MIIDNTSKADCGADTHSQTKTSLSFSGSIFTCTEQYVFLWIKPHFPYSCIRWRQKYVHSKGSAVMVNKKKAVIFKSQQVSASSPAENKCSYSSQDLFGDWYVGVHRETISKSNSRHCIIQGHTSNVMSLVLPQLLLIQYQVSYALSRAIVLMTQKLKQMTTDAWQEAAPANTNLDSLGLIAFLSNTVMSVSEVKSVPLCHTASYLLFWDYACTGFFSCCPDLHAKITWKCIKCLWFANILSATHTLGHHENVKENIARWASLHIHYRMWQAV